MQISVENTGGLSRKINLTIPVKKIDQEVSKKIQTLSKQVQLNGFRKGHVPVKVIKDKYGSSVRQEVLGEAIDSALNDAMKEKNLSPLGEVKLEKITDEANTDIECIFALDVYPEVKFNDLSEIKLKDYKVVISDADTEDGIKLIREQFGKTVVVDRAAKQGDVLTIDYAGLLDGKEFPGGSSKDAKVEIGSQAFIEGFESGLIGLKSGDKKDLDLQFPKDYAETSLAGKSVIFNVQVQQVAEKQLAELDQDLAKSLQVENNDVAKIKDHIVSNMEKYAEKLIKDQQSEDTIQALIATYPLELPEKLIIAEQRNLEATFKQKNKEQGININNLSEAVLADIKVQARKNVHLSLLLRELIQQNKLSVDEIVLQQKMQQFNGLFNNAPNNKQYQDMYANIKNSMINSMLTDIALKFVFDQSSKTVESIDFKQLTKSK
jgi:trigger factor